MISIALSSFLRTNSTGGFNYKRGTNATKLISPDRRECITGQGTTLLLGTLAIVNYQSDFRPVTRHTKSFVGL